MLKKAVSNEYPVTLQTAYRVRPKFLAALKLDFRSPESIKSVYSEEVASEIRREVRQRIVLICSESKQLQLSWSRNGLLIRVRGSSREAAEREAQRILKEIFIKICILPINTSAGAIIAPICASTLEVLGDTSPQRNINLGAQRFSLDFRSSREWSRVDMMRASAFFDALSKGDVLLKTQKVSTEAGGENIFFEDLSFEISHPNLGPNCIPLNSLFASLQNLGLRCLAEAALLSKAIDAIHYRNDLVLSCPLGWPSMEKVSWLQMALQDLDEKPSVARRLIVEFAGTGEFSPDAALNLAREFQKKGARIAVADFGDTLYPFDFILQCKPDIIKISDTGQWRHQAHPALLQQLVNLAHTFTRQVVIHSINPEIDPQIACAAGITWQGTYVDGRWHFLDNNQPTSRDLVISFPFDDDTHKHIEQAPSVGGAQKAREFASWRVSGGMG